MKRLLLICVSVAVVVLLLVDCSPQESNLPTPDAEYHSFECIAEERAPTVEECQEIVAELIAFAGGKELLTDMQYYLLSDLYLTYGDPMSNHVELRIWHRLDHNYRAHLQFRGSPGQNLISNGDVHVALRGQELMQSRGSNDQQIWLEYKTASMPQWLLRDDVSVRGEKPQMIEGDRLWIPLVVSDSKKPDITIWIDPYGPVIQRVEGECPLANISAAEMKLRRRLEFKDYERRSGYLLPTRIVGYVEEGGVWHRQSLQELQEFEIHDHIADEVFAPEIGQK